MHNFLKVLKVQHFHQIPHYHGLHLIMELQQITGLELLLLPRGVLHVLELVSKQVLQMVPTLFSGWFLLP